MDLYYTTIDKMNQYWFNVVNMEEFVRLSEPTDDEILDAQLDGLFDDESGDITTESLEADFQRNVRILTNGIERTEVPEKST